MNDEPSAESIEESALNVILVEDSEDDALLIIEAIRQGGCVPRLRRVETAETLSAALDAQRWDIVLADYALPQFDAPAALALIQARDLDLPLIIVSGTVTAETAVISMRAGAADYLSKNDLARLVPAIEREVREARSRAARRATEVARRQTEEKYRSLFSHAYDAILLVNTEGHIMDANPAAIAMSGYTWNELSAMPIEHLYARPEAHGDRLDGSERIDTMSDHETWLRRKDGAVRDVIITSSPWYGDAETRLGMFSIIRDITERKQGELARQRLAAIVEASDDAIIGKTLDGIVTSWNRGAEQLYGYAAPDIIGSSIRVLIPEDRADELEQILARIKRGEHITAYESVRVRKDGTRVPVSVTVSPLRDEYDTLIGASAIARDFSERKQAEEALRRSADRLHHLHAIDQQILALQPPHDIAAAVVHHIRQLMPCTGAALLQLGMDSDEATLLAAEPASFTTVLPSAWLAGKTLTLPDTLGDDIPYLVYDFATGETRTVEHGPADSRFAHALVPLRSSHGILGILCLAAAHQRTFNLEELGVACEVANHAAVALHNSWLFRQVRAGRTRQQHLARRIIEIQEAERRYLAFELHDEIGQVLTAVKMNLHTLRLRPNAADILSRLDESVSIVETAMNQTRNLAIALRPALLDDLGLASALRWHLDQQTQRAQLKAVVNIDLAEHNVPDEIASTCFRVAQEAITNVIRHARSTQVALRLYVDGTMLHLRIQDNGVGFNSADLQARVLEGKSLGVLSLTERAELVGGAVTIASELGRGTIVHGRFPLTSYSSHTNSADPVLERRRDREFTCR